MNSHARRVFDLLISWPTLKWPHAFIMKNYILLLLVIFAPAATTIGAPPIGQIHAGWAMTSITPDLPVALAGQFHKRISERIETPVTATALAIETRVGDQAIDQAIMVSCDLVIIADHIQPRLRKLLAGRLPGFDMKKLFLNATHTHSAPVTRAIAWYDVT